MRILACYDAGHETRESVAKLFGVSLGMVKKLLQQRKRVGDMAPLGWRAGRKPIIFMRHKIKLLEFLRMNPDATLKELRASLGLNCSLTAIHNALAKWGMTRKKRRHGPYGTAKKTLNRPVKTVSGNGCSGDLG